MQFVVFHMVIGLLLFVPLGFISAYFQYRDNKPEDNADKF